MFDRENGTVLEQDEIESFPLFESSYSSRKLKETFGFKTKNCPPVAEETTRLGEGIRIIPNIFFKVTQSQFQ